MAAAIEILDRPARVEDISAQLRSLGVATGGVLLVHCAFRRIRPVDDGPLGLIEALRAAVGPEGDIVMPSWTDAPAPFDPISSPAAADLGAMAELFWRREAAKRSAHPFAFAAEGPRADEILADPLPIPPHRPESPVGRVHALDGQVLLLGVGHDASTMLHLAEVMAGVPYRRRKSLPMWREGRVERFEFFENDHCCARFSMMDAWLRAEGLQSEGPVGAGWARLARAQDIVRIATARLAEDPLLFLHPPEARCPDCDDARASLG